MSAAALRTACLLIAIAGCKKKETAEPLPKALGDSGACPAQPDAKFDGRFAVGVLPHHRVPGLGEAAHCNVEFKAGPVTEVGVFTATCPKETTAHVFETVKVAKLVPMRNGIELPKPAVELTVGGTAMSYIGLEPNDRCGFRLDRGVGERKVGWTPGAGCETVVGTESANGDLSLIPRAAGTCTLAYDYLGHKGEFVVTVK